MGDEMTANPSDEALLTSEQRDDLALQLGRLNVNIERQFQLIERQQARESKAASRRWVIFVVVCAAVIIGNVRIEQVRNDADHRDRVRQVQEKHDTCLRTNEARRELRRSSDITFETIEKVTEKPASRVAVVKLAGDVHAQLAAALPVMACG